MTANSAVLDKSIMARGTERFTLSGFDRTRQAAMCSDCGRVVLVGNRTPWAEIVRVMEQHAAKFCPKRIEVTQ